MKSSEFITVRAKQFVTELFKNQTVPWEWKFRGSEEAYASFTVGKVPYLFHAYQVSGRPYIWDVSFMIEGMSDDNAYGLTGTGNASTVMSTVVNIMKAFLVEYKDKIDILNFSADEDSRQDLYGRMVHRLLPDWQMKHGAPHFELVKPEFAATKKKDHEREGITEGINPDILHIGFKHEQEIDGLRYVAKTEKYVFTGHGKTPLFVVRCYDGDALVGMATFYTFYKNYLVSQLTKVYKNYQRRGIASTMYAYARMLGNTIHPSKRQLPAGKKMWKSWGKTGDDKHLINESAELSYQGNCTDDDVIEYIFGDVNNFACMVDEHGDEFELGDLVVKYDPENDIHHFYYKVEK